MKIDIISGPSDDVHNGLCSLRFVDIWFLYVESYGPPGSLFGGLFGPRGLLYVKTHWY